VRGCFFSTIFSFSFTRNSSFATLSSQRILLSSSLIFSDPRTTSSCAQERLVLHTSSSTNGIANLCVLGAESSLQLHIQHLERLKMPSEASSTSPDSTAETQSPADYDPFACTMKPMSMMDLWNKWKTTSDTRNPTEEELRNSPIYSQWRRLHQALDEDYDV
jgi:hypothetical protein